MLMLALQKNHNYHGFDINVTGVWEYGITGKGITAVVVDDGMYELIFFSHYLYQFSLFNPSIPY